MPDMNTAHVEAIHPRILVIDDEEALTRALTHNLQQEGYAVLVAHDGEEGLRKVRTMSPDLVVLDLMLPVKNGFDVCRELRAHEQTRKLPILMLSGKSDEVDQIVGFSLGTDDYVTKPFSMTLLLQRIKALLRRSSSDTGPLDIIQHLGVTIDPARHRASYQGRELLLTLTEFRLLECLLRHPGRAFTRRQLMDAAAGEGSEPDCFERSMDIHIKSLRRKLDSADLIETVRGVGYRFRESQAPTPAGRVERPRD